MALVSILGDGGWGTAFALTAHDNHHRVRIWGAFPDYVEEVRKTRENRKYLPGFTIPPDIAYETDILAAVEGADIIVNAVPTRWVREVFSLLRDKGFRGGRLLSLTKGIETDTFKRPSTILQELILPERVAVLSGPSHAEEVARKLPASVVAASPDVEYARYIQKTFSTKNFRIYSDEDITGVEIAGALKNVIAVAAGICDGLELGDNAKAALIARGLAEISRLGVSMGANPATFYGLSGLGDLVTTCYSDFGRNRNVGIRIARGESLEKVLADMDQVAEGVWTVRSVVRLAREKGIPMPISTQVYNILFEKTPPRRAVKDLMSRNFREEKERWADG